MRLDRQIYYQEVLTPHGSVVVEGNEEGVAHIVLLVNNDLAAARRVVDNRVDPQPKPLRPRR